jgi:MFS family permease
MILEVFAGFTTMLLEIPSGAFADMVGRKQAMLLGSASFSLAYFIYLNAPGIVPLFPFILFIVARCLTATAITFLSGADSAFLYDSLKEIGLEKNFSRIMGNAQALYQLGIAFAALVGGLLTEVDISTPYVANVCIFLVASLVVLTFKEPRHYETLRLGQYWKHQMESVRFVFTHPRVRWITFFYGMIHTFTFIGLILFIQPYMALVGVPLPFFGFVYCVAVLFSAVIAKYCYRIDKKLGERKSLFMMPGFLFLAYLFMSGITRIYGVVFILLIYFVVAYLVPILDHHTHVHVESVNRATVLSVRNLAGGIASAIFSPSLGYVADTYSLTTSLLCSAVIILVLSVTMFPFFKLNTKTV